MSLHLSELTVFEELPRPQDCSGLYLKNASTSQRGKLAQRKAAICPGSRFQWVSTAGRSTGCVPLTSSHIYPMIRVWMVCLIPWKQKVIGVKLAGK